MKKQKNTATKTYKTKRGNLFTNKLERGRLIFYICMMALPILQVAIFYFGVNFNSVLLAFKHYAVDPDTGEKIMTWAGFENFKKIFYDIFHDSTWKFAIKNTFIIFFAITLANLALSLLFSFYIFRKGIGAKFFRVTLYMPSILSGIVMVILFEYFVNVFIPEIFRVITGMQMDGLMSNPKTTFGMLIFYSILTGFGSNVLLLSGAMSSISKSTLEAARIDGATEMQQFFRVIFPQIFPTFVTIFIVSISAFFSNQLNLFSFYGGNAQAKYYTVGYLLFNRTRSATIAQYPELAAIGVLLTLIIVPITLIVRKVLTKVGPSNG